MGRERPRTEDLPGARRDALWRVIWLCLLGGGGGVAVGALVLGGKPVQAAGVIVVVAMLQGAWRGGVAVMGAVLGMALALPLAFPLGRALEGVSAAVVGSR